MPAHPLEDVSLWVSLSRDEQVRVVRDELTLLGADWALCESSDAGTAIVVEHRPTTVRFVPIPGGRFRMGLLDEELELIDLYLGSRPHILEQVHGVQKYAQPIREIRVQPFLCGQTLLTDDLIAGIFPEAEPNEEGAVRRPAALALCEKAGFRLPSDAELEWLARQGKGAPFVLDRVFQADEDDEENILITNQAAVARLGIADLIMTQWAADDWFDDHRERPETAVARTGGDPQGVRRFEEFYFECMGEESVISQLSARRDPGYGWEAGVRFALDLPSFRAH